MTRLRLLLIVGALLSAGLLVQGFFRAGAGAGAGTADDGKSTEKPRPASKRAPVASREDEAALRKVLQSFSVSFNKGDLDSLVGMWTEEGEYSHESGKVYRGREAIRVMLKKALANLKGYKQTVKSDSIRFIRPDVVLAEGTVTVTSPDGGTEGGKYSAILVKQDGKWLFEHIRDLSEAEDQEKPPAYHRLKGLEWMVGEWQDKEGKGEVKLSCKWGPNQTFLLQEITVKQDDGKMLYLSLRIGWDAQNQTIRSWTFDSTGGFSSGSWIREGNSWIVESDGFFADGRVGTSTDQWKFVDGNTATWMSKARQADEEPLPDIELTLVRKPKDR